MSRNWNTRDLIAVLKQRDVLVSKVRIGDVLVTDFGPVQVARIEKEEDIFGVVSLRFFDAYDNNEGGAPRTAQVRIVDRRALDRDACQRVLQRNREEERAWPAHSENAGTRIGLIVHEKDTDE